MPAGGVQPGDTAWVLTCTALVLFMTPGLALFYAGMVRTRTTLVMMMQNIIPLGVVSILWILLGFALAFSNDHGGVIGDLELFGLRNIAHSAPAPAFRVVTGTITIPTLAFVAYQMMFAVITPALITGATADRLKFAGWVAFTGLWSLIVYVPITHWLWATGGWLARLGAQDWAGGMVVHASAGAAVLAVLLVIGRRQNWPRTGTLPNSLPLTIAGAGILWFGWFGFNAGDGLRADDAAAQALLNTQVAAAAAMLVWLIAERFTDGHATVVGAVSGAVAGLAAITPCAGYVTALSALAIGVLAGLACHFALRLKFALRFDDALDVIAVHFVGGVLGSLLVGFFATRSVNPTSADGLFAGGSAGLLGHQALAIVVVVAYSFCLTWLIASVVQKTIGLRADPANEQNLDQVQQGMDAYHLSGAAALPGAARPGGDHVGAEPADPAPVPQCGRAQLVTSMLEPQRLQADELERALLAAGAATIMLSNAHVRTPFRRPQVIRGFRRDQEFPDRLRVEVLVDAGHTPTVLAALGRFTTQPGDSFIQDVQTADSEPAP